MIKPQYPRLLTTYVPVLPIHSCHTKIYRLRFHRSVPSVFRKYQRYLPTSQNEYKMQPPHPHFNDSNHQTYKHLLHPFIPSSIPTHNPIPKHSKSHSISTSTTTTTTTTNSASPNQTLTMPHTNRIHSILTRLEEKWDSSFLFRNSFKLFEVAAIATGHVKWYYPSLKGEALAKLIGIQTVGWFIFSGVLDWVKGDSFWW